MRDPKYPENLAIVNVEAVHTRWVTDIGAFLDAADDLAFLSLRRRDRRRP